MTRVTFLTDPSGNLRGFRTDGHSGFDDAGKDIVCAAVSVLTLNTVNSVEQLTDDAFKCEQDEKKGLIEFLIEGECSEKTKLLLDSYRLGIEEISRTYGHRFVKVSYKEV